MKSKKINCNNKIEIGGKEIRNVRDTKFLGVVIDENLDGLIETTKRHNINADIEQTGLLKFATAEWQLEELEDKVSIFKQYVNSVKVLDKKQAQNEINSPTYVGGLIVNNNTLILDPAKLTWGLKETCEKLGVIFYELINDPRLSRFLPRMPPFSGASRGCCHNHSRIGYCRLG